MKSLQVFDGIFSKGGARKNRHKPHTVTTPPRREQVPAQGERKDKYWWISIYLFAYINGNDENRVSNDDIASEKVAKEDTRRLDSDE